jgi:16S rRNA (cytosine1402-N4)-methyltransferase
MSTHVPVLLNEAVDALQIRPGGRYIDCTVGEGGHVAAVLEHGGSVLGIDINPKAIEIAQERLRPYGDTAILINNNYADLEQIASAAGFKPAQGILFDLGVSSLQLADACRGFSFQLDAPLDMRFDPHQKLTAATVVNTFSEQDLADIIKRYGEEHRSSNIARSIVANRPLNTTTQLASVVAKTVGRRGRIHPATKTFQALRIFVNQELERLKAALKQAVNILEARGRLVVISFHSLEDRLVKEFFNKESQDCICPPRTPICICNHHASLKLITRKVIKPSHIEVQTNPRSRSAKMRVAERI